MTLFDIDQRIRAFTERLFAETDDDGAVSDEIDISELEQLNMARRDKLESIALVIKEKTARIDALKKQKAAVQSWIDRDTKTVEWLKRYMTNSMMAAGEDLIETERCRVTFRTTKDCVDIDDEEQIPRKFFTKKITYAPDKKAIKEILKSGKKVKGCHLADHNNIQIK